MNMIKRSKTMKHLMAGALITIAAFCSVPALAAQPLKVGYSDWPGWVAWQVAIDKGWFKEAGVDVSFEWFDYSASMEAFAAGKIDAVTMTNGDALVTGSGAKTVIARRLFKRQRHDYCQARHQIAERPEG
jgi:NitT/TauT family transport system substrate-binding protein